jgi:hypothetical protein
LKSRGAGDDVGCCVEGDGDDGTEDWAAGEPVVEVLGLEAPEGGGMACNTEDIIALRSNGGDVGIAWVLGLG